MASHRSVLVASVLGALFLGTQSVTRTAPVPSPLIQTDPLQEAVANLGERCYPGDAFGGSPRALGEVLPTSIGSNLIASSSSKSSVPFALVAKDNTRWKLDFQRGPAPARDLTGTTDFKELSSLADIERVLYRKAQGEIVLIGPPAEDGRGLRFDDWVAAFRSVSQYGSPGVSIDPADNPNIMKVRYLGGIERTHMGATFFEADRTLKLLSTGFDNLDCSRWPLKPDDLRTQIDLIDAEMRSATAADRGWHRFWFEPTADSIKEEVVATSQAARFEERRLAVLDESIPPGRQSWSAQQFSAAISSRFMSLTAQVPAFRELQQQAVLVSLAKWMVDRGIPAERAWLQDGPVVTETPDVTPSITVMRATLLDQGYLRYGIHGGVDFQKPNKYEREAGISTRILAALQVRPAGTMAWTFSSGGKRLRAVAWRYKTPVPIGRQVVSWQRTYVMLPQPGLARLVFPDGYVRGLARLIINNDDASATVTVNVTGPTSGFYVLAPNTQTSVGVRPGSYRLDATALCGARTASASSTRVLSEGSIATSRYNCVIRAADGGVR